ncbi:MAG TPA: glycosyltransferase [Gemmatimonadales bacterium]|nr:glycosyltransferase [Gemmatimonadales bacterium]
MRVVLLTHSYPRWPGDFAGAAQGALARALVRRGMSVRVVVPSEDSAGRAELEGVVVDRVRVARAAAEALRDPDALATRLRRPLAWASLLRVWRSLRIAARRQVAAGADVVHAHWWIPSGLATPRGVPVVLTIHGADAGLLQRSRLARTLAQPLWRRTTLVTAVSPEVGDSVQILAGRSMPAEHIQPMPIETKGLPWTRGGDGAVLLGRLDHQGRVELAIETVAILASSGHAMPLTIVGDGPARRRLQQRAEQLGVSALVQFAGSLPPDQARSYLARADVLLFTSRSESNAGPALDALITGVPIVSCWDSGAVVGVVPQSGPGRLCLPTADALAESVVHLQADKDRLALSRLVGESWRARLAPDHVAERCESWYRDALAQ